MNKVRLMLLSQFFRHQAFAGAPDEIHFRVRGAERQPRLKNQEHAAVEKKEGADQTHRHRDPGAASTEKRNYTDGHTRRHEHSDREIESTTRPSRLEVDRIMVPLAEINTAGVIMAVKTASDEDNPSISISNLSRWTDGCN